MEDFDWVSKLTSKPKDELTPKETQKLIDTEKRLLDACKQYKDWIKDNPDTFPVMPRILKN